MFTLIVIILSLGVTLLFTVNNYRLRQQLNTARTELTEATRELATAADTNKQLRENIEGARTTVTELGNITNSNIGTIGECIQLVRDIRKKVEGLENILLCGDTSSLGYRDSNSANSK